jgi:L-alanine-DL-glutamate epimerase-like enolase superfamily enzyme
MKQDRRWWMKTAVCGAVLGAGVPLRGAVKGAVAFGRRPWERRLFNWDRTFPTPVKIRSMELLRAGSTYFVRTRSEDGVVGLIVTKQIDDFIPIFLNKVVPFFVGKDARELETLIDRIYIENYKMVGQAFWCPVAYAEQSLLDLLGKTAGKPVGELMGGVIRREIPVYLSGSGRDTSAEQEVAVYAAALEQSGARAVKLKIGGRMSRNADVYPGRTEAMIALVRKTFGEDIILYADANGSYDSAKGVEIGRLLEDHQAAFFEEPCPWEDYEETLKVTQALEIPVAAGEQDSSLPRFEWMIRNRVMDIVQPDLNYNGGLVRSSLVARIAEEAGMRIVPHNTQTGPSGFNILQFASCTRNIGPFMEYPFRGGEERQSWYSPRLVIKNGVLPVPTGPGMGVEFDPDFIAKAEIVL